MLKDSFQHAEDDMHARSLIEEQVEADRVLESLRSALEKDAKQLLSQEELSEIIQAQEVLKRARDGTDTVMIKDAIKQLEKASETFVARRMNQSVQQVMKGHRVEEFE